MAKKAKSGQRARSLTTVREGVHQGADPGRTGRRNRPDQEAGLRGLGRTQQHHQPTSQEGWRRSIHGAWPAEDQDPAEAGNEGASRHQSLHPGGDGVQGEAGTHGGQGPAPQDPQGHGEVGSRTRPTIHRRSRDPPTCHPGRVRAGGARTSSRLAFHGGSVFIVVPGKQSAWLARVLLIMFQTPKPDCLRDAGVADPHVS